MAWFSTAGFHQRSKWIDVRGGRQVQPAAAGLERDHEERRAAIVLKLADQIRPLADRSAAVQDQARPAEDRRQKIGQRLRHRLKLREDQHLFLPFGDRLAEHRQPPELAAFFRRESRASADTAPDDCRFA